MQSNGAMFVKPLTVTSLNHRAYRIAVASRSGEVVALTPDGPGSLFVPGSSIITPLKLPECEAVTIHPDGTKLVLATEHGLLLVHSHSGAEIKSAPGSFNACHFSASGDLLWAARCLSADQVSLEARDSASLALIASALVDDPFGDSSFMLTPTPDESKVSVWVAAEQDGQSVVWGSLHGSTLSAERCKYLSDTTPPAFSSEAEGFLVISQFAELHHYLSYPPSSLHRCFTGPGDGDDDESQGDSFGDYAAFAGLDHAIVQTRSGRLYPVNLITKALGEEIIVADSEQCTELTYFLPLPCAGFLSAHRLLNSSPFNRKDQIVTWDFPSRFTKNTVQLTLF